MGRTLRSRVLGGVVPGVIGAAVGYTYARETLPPELMKTSSLPAMYAACGAAILILAVRLSAVLRMIWNELRSRRHDEPR